MNKSKLVLLHGPARVASRSKLLDLKQKFDPNNVVVFEGSVSSQEVSSSLATLPMFSDERVIVLENPEEAFVLDSSLTTSYASLILWFDHEVGEKNPIIEWVKKGQGEVIYFPEGREISVFHLLDLLADGNSKAFLEIKKLKTGGYDIFYFNTMVIYLLRNLINTPKNAPAFVKEKLKRQRIRFNQQKLTNLYKNILELDFKLKSGLIEVEQAEFSLVSKFM